MKATKRFLLTEREIPTQYYNVLHDLKIMPLLNPATKQPMTPKDLEPIFAEGLCKQEFATEQFIDIPDEVRDLYKIYRPTPLVHATGLEKALDTPAKIFFKNESVSPVGSHKLNSALAQAYYNKKQGVKSLTTETGAGQWGSAIALAAKHFGLNMEVYMVRVSYDQKPYRKCVMQTYGATVHSSPSNTTEAGRKFLAADPDTPGTLGMAISEAIERAVSQPETKYTLGSVLNFVMLHQTVVGQEAEKQMEMAGEKPDIVIGCFGGGSNFGGLMLPFLRHQLAGECNYDFIAAESTGCPKLTQGTFRYDFGDSAGMTPLIPMYTLGNDYVPAPIHAGGLRYHGAGAIMSQLLKDKVMRAVDIDQHECFDVGTLFARTEGIIPAPESTHAIAVAVREALKCKEEGKSKTILFNLSGHGLLDLQAYSDYFEGKI
ncbi:MAG: TrpB-like pyridoxal phosphate-dependent enzyme [Bacteroidales bacterium]|jgi:tryptophan synthase beta chain|nr:TrpB-like pyridoxal phosphate-dependent enzyme [Bacteroidales bacterium]MCI2121827.1 TrpB-like pyridoxal phosphate-dependent enzyme [Bacteroidales bacterium]MCI2146058.1 TrpB-like pyridoxal phosphate-dependent enzyme [Bacteroidales bacterium]